MSTLVCTRCQKIYPAANPPTKCVNCGGTISTARPVAKAVIPQAPTPQVKPVANPKPVNATSNRPCNRPNCTEQPIKSVMHVYSEKQIIVTPLTPTREHHTQDLCSKHWANYSGPNGWTLSHKLIMPPLPETEANNIRETAAQHPKAYQPQSSSDDGEGCITFIVGLIMIAVIGFIAWQIFMWLAGMDWGSGNDGDVIPFRIPVRRWR